MINQNEMIKISNSLLGKYCQELNLKNAQEVNNEQLALWLKTQIQVIGDMNEK